MALTPLEKEELRAAIADRLVDMESMFDARCKLTFVMRAPHLADGDVVVTTDDIPAVVKALERLQTYDAIVPPVPSPPATVTKASGGDGAPVVSSTSPPAGVVPSQSGDSGQSDVPLPFDDASPERVF